jgi:hypothetical protein
MSVGLAVAYSLLHLAWRSIRKQQYKGAEGGRGIS